MMLIRSNGIYDSDKRKISENDGLLIDNEEISTIGRFQELVQKYPRADVLDYSDCFLFPGLINTHVHLEFDATCDVVSNYMEEEPSVRFLRASQNANKMLLSGTTTVRDAGSTWDLLNLHKTAVQDIIQLPRLQLAGPPITITGGHLHFMGEEADTIDEAVRSVRLHKKRGCAAIKLIVTGGQMTPGSRIEHTSYTLEQIQAMTHEAYLLNLPTFAHCLTTDGFVSCARGNVGCIEHAACFVRNEGNGLLERVYEPSVMEEFRGKPLYFMNGISAPYHAFDHCRNDKSKQTPKEAFLLEQERRECEIFNKYIELGMIPVVGTDAGVTFSYFNETSLELELFVEMCGMSTADAIHAGTVSSAECLNLERLTGKLAEGMAADIVGLPENPLNNIRAFRNIRLVIANSKIVKER